jgi:hypothetical protein
MSGVFYITGVSTEAWASQVCSDALGIARISKFVVLEAFATDPTEMGQIEDCPSLRFWSDWCGRKKCEYLHQH